MLFKWRRKIKNIEQDNKYANEMISYLDEIRFDSKKGSISKKNLETFWKKFSKKQSKIKETSNIKDKNKRIEEKIMIKIMKFK